MTNTFVFAFSEEGFETIINLSELDMEFVQKKMAGETLPQSPGSVLNFLQLRARYNAQRNMEVWALGADDGLTESDLWDWANSDPQGLAEALRDRGHNIYGAEYSKTKKVIV